MKSCDSGYDAENEGAILVGARDIRIMRLSDPVLSPGQVRVKIAASAICGTQIGEWRMTRGPDPYLPHCFGHEAVGRVLEVGSAVTTIQVNDRVVISWMKRGGDGDGAPKFTSDGNTLNFGECCTFVRRAVVPENRVTKIDEVVDDEVAAILGCAFLTAHAALRQTTQGFTIRDAHVAVIGAGGVGLAAGLIASAKKIPYTCIDVPQVIHQLSKQNPELSLMSTGDARASLSGRVPVAIVCTGAVSGFELAESLLPKNGGILCFVGNPALGVKIGLDIKPLLYNRRVLGIGEKDVRLPDDLVTLIDLVKCGQLNAGQAVQNRRHLFDIQLGFEEVDAGTGGRTIIKID